MRRVALAASIALALGACAEQAGPGQGGSGIRGRVVAGPTCPVETEASPCPPRPVQTQVRVRSGGETVLTFESEKDGTFRVDLEPGDYVLVAQVGGTGARVARPAAVKVEPGTYAEVEVLLDTGLRSANSA